LIHECLLIEEEIDAIFNKNSANIFCFEDKRLLESLESRKSQILLLKEEEWRLKSRVVWIKCGDNNFRFFHNFAKKRRISNYINGIFVMTKASSLTLKMVFLKQLFTF